MKPIGYATNSKMPNQKNVHTHCVNGDAFVESRFDCEIKLVLLQLLAGVGM